MKRLACALNAFALLAAALLCACESAPPAPAWPIPPDAKTRVVNGYPIAYVEKGSGPTIVLVHGALTDYRYWQPQLDAWSPRFHVVAISLRHFYPEKWQGGGDDFSVQQNAKDLTAFIETLGTPVYLLGWSYGGGVAYQTALARPDLVKGLVLDEGGLVSRPEVRGNGAERSKQTAAYFTAGDIDGGLNYSIDSINGAGAWSKTPEAARIVVRDNAWTIIGVGMVSPPEISCAEFGSLKMPVLLVQGEYTTASYKQALDAQAACLPSAKRATIPKAGHPSAYMNPRAFNETVGAFFSSL